jgi:hypothetical protein
MTNNTIEIQHAGMKIVYDTKHMTWTADGIAEEAVRKINGAVANDINKDLEKQVTEYKARIEKEELDKRKAMYDKYVADIEAFKAEAMPFLPEGYEVRFINPGPFKKFTWPGDVKHITLMRGNINGYISYDAHVSSGRGYYSSNTNLPWVVDVSCKKHRYSTLEAALKSAAKKMGEVAEEEKNKANKASSEEIRIKNLTARLETLGMKLNREWNSTSHMGGYRGKGYYNEYAEGKIGDMQFKSRVSVDHDDNLQFSNITLIRKFNIGEIVNMSMFLNNLFPNKTEEDKK